MKTGTFAKYFYLLFIILFNNQHAFAQAKASTAIKIAPTKAEDTIKNTNFWTHGSLMIDKKNLAFINAGIKSYNERISIGKLLPDLFPAPYIYVPPKNEKNDSPPSTSDSSIKPIDKKLDIPQEAPAFYLKSILYFAPNNWSLWLNDKKISDKASDYSENISVINTSRSQVLFLWQNSKIDLIYPDWKNNFQKEDDNKYTSPEKNIVVDTSDGSISFILKPNQSLVSKTLEIVEGPAIATPLTIVAPTQAAEAKKPEPDNSNEPTESPQIIQKNDATTNKDNAPTKDPLNDINKLKSILNQNVKKLR